MPFNARRGSGSQRRPPTTEWDPEEESSYDEEEDQQQEDEEGNEDSKYSDEDGVDDATPLLPIFSTAILDALPVFQLTHSIRLMVISKVDTTLSWEQLRSPQISSFLLRPLQQEIRSNHFSAATQYALMANCLQFNKEMSITPGNSGTNRTRSMVCELLAIRLLKEHSMRELIDSLCYDFNPLQGQDGNGPVDPETARSNNATRGALQKPQAKIARISCLEVAIRASAKRLLAHPMVVQLLEAIWAGSIVFHAAADSMHRRGPMESQKTYGTLSQEPGLAASYQSLRSTGHRVDDEQDLTARRSVTLYDPRDASLFKLSRLRVPRYRNLLSTCSFAVLLGLFLAVLVERSLNITPLEIVFWFWAAGYMLDEIVGFNEQGFSLYVASFWNTFDLGILLILFAHLCLRIYGIVMPDTRKHTVANMAYDVLAADAILLFPRLFSVLDHYRYFSTLLIAFRMMAVDLVAVFLLIVISCSGFFVALTLSFGNEGIDTPSSVAYALLQILMGFTPAAWDRWSGYNVLGKTILTLFLFICHFLVVTILITVLTNSFMAIVQNANEEHQFVFAVNALSMVKSDALFAYVAPTNVLAWILTPLRYFLPFRQFLRVNRTVIKATHFLILFTIYFYEKAFLQSSVVEAIDIVESRGRSAGGITQKMTKVAREPSIATFRQDAALEAVFRRPFDSTMRTTQHSQERKTSTVVSNWMKIVDEAVASPPAEQDHKIVDRLERRPYRRSSRLGAGPRNFSRSVASDPEDFGATTSVFSPELPKVSPLVAMPTQREVPDSTDADGDDELATDDNDEDKVTLDQRSRLEEGQPGSSVKKPAIESDYFAPHPAPEVATPHSLGPALQREASQPQAPIPTVSILSIDQAGRLPPMRPGPHLRNASSATVVYKPDPVPSADNSSLGSKSKGFSGSPSHLRMSAVPSGAQTPLSKPNTNASGHASPRRQGAPFARMRPIMPPKETAGFQSDPNLAGLLASNRRGNNQQRRSSLELDLVSDLGDNKAIGGGYVGALPASFAAQMARSGKGHHARADRDEDRDLFGRLMMARMNSLEEGFRDIVHEMRDHLRRERSDSRSRSPSRSRERPARPAQPSRTSQLKRERDAESSKGSGPASEVSTEQSREADRTQANVVAAERASTPILPGVDQTPVVTREPEKGIESQS